MTIVVAANDSQWNELISHPVKTEWVRVTDASSFENIIEADAYFNLHDDAHLFIYPALNKPVFINAVTHTLYQLGTPRNIFRINGWPGFLKRPVWEIAGKTDDAVQFIFTAMNKKMSIVKDVPGLIAARIIAMIINEAYFTLGDNVSTKSEIDTAMKLGTNYPFGPFEWATAIGLRNILILLKQLNITDQRYQPAELLIAEATAAIQ